MGTEPRGVVKGEDIVVNLARIMGDGLARFGFEQKEIGQSGDRAPDPRRRYRLAPPERADQEVRVGESAANAAQLAESRGRLGREANNGPRSNAGGSGCGTKAHWRPIVDTSCPAGEALKSSGVTTCP